MAEPSAFILSAPPILFILTASVAWVPAYFRRRMLCVSMRRLTLRISSSSPCR